MASPSIEKARRVARNRLGIRKPYKHQLKAWRAAIEENKSVFSVMPTGSGKSAAFQVPCIVRKGLSVVVSPLLALMREQVERLRNAGVRAFRIGMDMSKREIREALSAVRSKEAKIIYVAPERLQNQDFLDVLERRKVGTIVVDEAHCMSFWSRDFRPAYKAVGIFRQRFYNAVVMALTATADEFVEKDIVSTLRLYDHERIVGAPDRPNLSYESVDEADVSYIVKALETGRRMGGDGCGIVYCASRRHVDDTVFRKLRYGCNLAVAKYHAGMDSYQRQRIQDEFMNGDYDLIVATNAFGMGIDKPDVRLVYHFDYPESVFAYAQEAGRAGRDGLPSLCVLNISKKGTQIRNFLANIANPKFYVYERLWRNFLRNRKFKPFILNSSQLDRIGGSSLDGTGTSAMRYMEYKRAIRTRSGQLKYVLPIVRHTEAVNICRDARVRYDVDDDNQLVIELPADYNGGVIASLRNSHSVIMRRPIEGFVLERIADDLRVTPDDVSDKRSRTDEQIDEVFQFAAAHDKHEFLSEAFLK